MVQKVKNRYWLALSNGSSNTNNFVIVWDYYNNAFSFYSGINASAMTTLYITSTDERPHFADYLGYVYRADFGVDDYPAKTQTAIDSYYYTNWKTLGDLVDQKGVTQTYIYYESSNAVLTFAYSYDFESSDQYTQTMSLAQGTSVYGSAIYGTGVYSGVGGAVVRRDLTGRGRTVRIKFANSNLTETMQIDGFGINAHMETNV